MESKHDPLETPRWLMMAIALPGLALFVGLVGVAAHAGLREFAPWLPGGAAMAISALLPIAFLLGIGVYGALCDSESTGEATRRWTRRFRLAALVAVGAATLWQLAL